MTADEVHDLVSHLVKAMSLLFKQLLLLKHLALELKQLLILPLKLLPDITD